MNIVTPERIDALRSLAFSMAYRMLGQAADAEDIAQEALVKLLGTPRVENQEALITTIATRLSIDVLRSARARRETYVGDWLPEPLVAEDAAGPAHAELADDLSTAFLVLLETLSPIERAAFLLHETLGFSHREAAAVIDRSEQATRKIVSRARARIADRRPRHADAPRQRAELVERFLAACEHGLVDEFVELLHDDVVLTGDSGGNVPRGVAISKPVSGRRGVTKLLLGFSRYMVPAHFESRTVNGTPGAVIVAEPVVGGGLIAVIDFEFTEGRISHIRSVINPDKLRHLGHLADLHAFANGRTL
ncbi:RNA polymerase sigma-70 factor (ECF subfamily) [Murinocardiopsis flavida]|uniref:RNA polymerase sigma-70 factor (ECF subfamily) n=1 Tax=Murinocardiopsis flavida TaxID=645275 RepID=A0A2P8DEJ2_9ACTN|nr:RNA polymerase sigma factor SigJ [Murinocardiopsis flavida]PSK95635.1 RNA polymerase sigma-70 factor (ECF subfamily) [Murinocardiopsis flavida]